MTDRPIPPSPADLKKVETALPGSAKILFDQYRIAVTNYERRVDEDKLHQTRQENHAVFLRYLSIVCGTLLALASLSLSAFAIQRGASLTPLAAVLAPIAGIAGVFLWGYRISDTSKSATKRRLALGVSHPPADRLEHQ